MVSSTAKVKTFCLSKKELKFKENHSFHGLTNFYLLKRLFKKRGNLPIFTTAAKVSSRCERLEVWQNFIM